MFRPLLSLFVLLTSCAPGPSPIASAGAEVVGEPGQTFLLDGSASEAQGARYMWSVLDGPDDAHLIDPHEPVAFLVPEAEGVYTLGLEVCDALGRCEAATTRAIVGAKARQAAFGGPSLGGPSFGGFGKNQAPQANASASRSFASMAIIRLDGSGSTDPDGDTLRYRWSFTTKPADSALTDADIQDSTSALASFKADASGTYGVRLVVRDGLASSYDLVPGIVVKVVEDHDPVDEDTTPPRWSTVEGADARQSAFGGPSFGGFGKNQAPQATASASRSLGAGSLIRLDGSGSTDPDGDTLRYRWSFTTKPADSALTDADIQDSTSALASFKADTSGTYGVRLIVRDGVAFSSDLVPDIVVKIVQDDDPIDDTAPRWGAVEGADAP